MKHRYERNIPAISLKQQALLAQKRVLVIGCGGLGGYILEYLTRLGVGHLTAVDGDVFETSNLNRQLNSSPELLGQKKAFAAAARIKSISPDTDIQPVDVFLDQTNADSLIKGQDLVIDALDNVSSRFIMEDACERHQVTFVHGAILGWSIQAAVGRPGSQVLHKLYPSSTVGKFTDPILKTSLSITPPFCAAIEVAEAIKILTDQEPSLDNKLLTYNLQTMEQLIIPVS